MSASLRSFVALCTNTLYFILLGLHLPPTLQAAEVVYSLTNFNEGTLNLEGALRAVNFHETDSFEVTINGHTANFEATGPAATLTEEYGFTNYTPSNSMLPTYTNANPQDTPELANVLLSHAWIARTTAPVHLVPITGLTPGQSYEIQLFFHDGRTGSCGGFGCANRTVGFGDDFGGMPRITTEQVPRGAGTIAVGLFTADSDTQNVAVGNSDTMSATFWDAGLSGLVLRIGEPVQAGDTDGDLDVDQIDFAAIRDHFFLSATTKEEGDLNRDGIVNFGDFRIWKDNFPTEAPAESSAIPEPASAWLLLLSGLAAMCRYLGPNRYCRR